MRLHTNILPLLVPFVVRTAADRCFHEVNLREDGVVHTRLILEECCSGYLYVEGVCEPLCTSACNAGTCIRPNECVCYPGWYGDTCDSSSVPCKDGYWGVECEYSCKCNSFGCSRLSGHCECGPGYNGTNCLNPCPRNLYGLKCLQKCDCENCRNTDGYCKCQEGWNGAECTDYCPISLYDKMNSICINHSQPFILLTTPLYFSFSVVVLVIIIVPVIVYFKCRKTRQKSAISIRGQIVAMSLSNILNSNEYRNNRGNVYETIPGDSKQGTVRSNTQRLQEI